MGDTLNKKLKDYLDGKPNYEKFDILYNELSYDMDFIKNLYPDELKTFEDLKFKKHPNFYLDDAVQAVINFDNGHFASVVGGGWGLYGDGVNTFEIGYPLPGDSIDVEGWLSPEEITKVMFEIQMKKPLK